MSCGGGGSAPCDCPTQTQLHSFPNSPNTFPAPAEAHTDQYTDNLRALLMLLKLKFLIIKEIFPTVQLTEELLLFTEFLLVLPW
jgi:hypothetical protein